MSCNAQWFLTSSQTHVAHVKWTCSWQREGPDRVQLSTPLAHIVCCLNCHVTRCWVIEAGITWWLTHHVVFWVPQDMIQKTCDSTVISHVRKRNLEYYKDKCIHSGTHPLELPFGSEQESLIDIINLMHSRRCRKSGCPTNNQQSRSMQQPLLLPPLAQTHAHAHTHTHTRTRTRTHTHTHTQTRSGELSCLWVPRSVPHDLYRQS